MKRIYLFLVSLLLLAGLQVRPAAAAGSGLTHYLPDGSLFGLHRLMPVIQSATLSPVVAAKVSLDSGNGQAQPKRQSDALLPDTTSENLIAEDSDAELGVRGLMTPRSTTCRPPKTCRS
jgi:hypothetical protein